MPIPLGTQEPGVPVTQKLDPWQAYQAALYRGAPASETPSYEVYGSSPKSPTGIGSGPGMGALIGMSIARHSAAPAATAASQAAFNAPALAATSEVGGMSAVPAGFYGSTAAPASTGVLGTGLGAAPLAGIGLATYLGGKAGYDMLKGRKPGLPGRIVLGVATGGLSEVAKHLGLFGHESTKDYQRKIWNKHAESTDPLIKSYADSYLKYLDSDQAKIDAQPENRFGYKLEHGTLRPEDVWGGEGNIDTFGSDWFGKYNQDQRKAISQALIDNKLVSVKKGVQYHTDQAKAKEIAAGALAKMLVAPVTQKLPSTIRKDSPGFKNGKRINY